jgi:hypothetical protein
MDKKVKCKLTGEDGNAFAIMGRVRSALRRANIDAKTIVEYQKEATSGDYENLLAVSIKYLDVNGIDWE